MSDYRPTYPIGWIPRHLRGEYSTPMDSVRPRQEAPPHSIPEHIRCERVPPGARPLVKPHTSRRRTTE